MSPPLRRNWLCRQRIRSHALRMALGLMAFSAHGKKIPLPLPCHRILHKLQQSPLREFVQVVHMVDNDCPALSAMLLADLAVPVEFLKNLPAFVPPCAGIVKSYVTHVFLPGYHLRAMKKARAHNTTRLALVMGSGFWSTGRFQYRAGPRFCIVCKKPGYFCRLYLQGSLGSSSPCRPGILGNRFLL